MIAIALVSGCDALFNIDQLDPGHDAAGDGSGGVDVPTIDAPPTPCRLPTTPTDNLTSAIAFYYTMDTGSSIAFGQRGPNTFGSGPVGAPLSPVNVQINAGEQLSAPHLSPEGDEVVFTVVAGGIGVFRAHRYNNGMWQAQSNL